MKTIRHKETLFYYDCVQVFSAVDRIGGSYICVLARGDDSDSYLAAGVSPERLREFRAGKSDLRSLITQREGEEWFIVESGGDLAAELELEVKSGPVPEDLLPAEGFFLTSAPVNAEAVQKESKVRRNLVLEIWMDPPEAAVASRIRAETLAGFVSNVQTVLKHAYSKSLKGLSAETRRGLDVNDAHTIDAFAFAGGSFKVFFEAEKGPDLFGFVELKRAMEKLDELTANGDSPGKALEVMKENRGHLVGAYIRLLEFLVRTDTAFAYRWSDPGGETSHGRTITARQAGPLLEEFKKVAQLGVETVELHGYLREADSKRNSWRIESLDDGKEYPGEVAEGVSVSNLTIDKIYRFFCEERIEEQVATGREKRTLLLVRHSEG